jgi:hypothetical protein
MAEFGGKKFIFIVSSGRTGTKAIAQHLSRCYPEVFAVHEPAPSWRLRMATTRAICGRAKKEELIGLLVKLRRNLIERVSQPIYVESNPYLSGFVEVLGEVFENPLVVHVVRDPRTYVRSAVNFGAFRGLKKLASEVWPNWFPKPEMCVDERIQSGLQWAKMDEIERLSWFWTVVNNHISVGKRVHGDRYLQIGFEKLFSPDGGGLSRLTSWMGLPESDALRAEANKERVNASRGNQLPAWEKWGLVDQSKLLEFCGRLMEVYGYLPDVRVEGKAIVAEAM